MPKTILQQLYTDEPIKRFLRAKMAESRVRVSDLPGARSNWQRWLNNPGDMKVRSMVDFVSSLQMTKDEKVQLIREIIETYQMEQL